MQHFERATEALGEPEGAPRRTRRWCRPSRSEAAVSQVSRGLSTGPGVSGTFAPCGSKRVDAPQRTLSPFLRILAHNISQMSQAFLKTVSKKEALMEIPLEVNFRNMDPSPAVEARIREKAAKLERFHDRIIGCTVVVEAPHRHHHKGKLYSVHIDISVPGKDLVVDRAKPPRSFARGRLRSRARCLQRRSAASRGLYEQVARRCEDFNPGRRRLARGVSVRLKSSRRL